MIKLKKITYHESYIKEAPAENFWRGITVMIDGITVYRISYFPHSYKPFVIESVLYERTLYKGIDDIVLLPKRAYKTKEGAKKAIRRSLEKFFSLFIENE